MKNRLLDRVVEGVVDWKNRQGDIARADGPMRLLAAAVAMEKEIATLVAGQSCHTKAFLLAAKMRPKEEAIPLLFHALQSSNLWLEAMMMLHWITFSRIKGMASFFEWENSLAEKSEQAVLAVEACRLSWTATYSLALAFLGLAEQIMPELANPRHPPHEQRLAEQRIVQMLEQLEDFFRILLRKSDFLQTLFAEQEFEVETSVQELRSALHAYLKNLEVYYSPSVTLSASFQQRLKDSVLPLKKYGKPKESVRHVVQTPASYPAPWLNRGVFPGKTKSHKAVEPAKMRKKEP